MKPDRFTYGKVYTFLLPKQIVEDFTDGKRRPRLGVEQCDAHRCLVVSNDEFNGVQSRGVVVVPITSAQQNGKEKFTKPQGPWVRGRCGNETVYFLCEQVRYVDRSRCLGDGEKVLPMDVEAVEKKLKDLLTPDPTKVS